MRIPYLHIKAGGVKRFHTISHRANLYEDSMRQYQEVSHCIHWIKPPHQVLKKYLKKIGFFVWGFQNGRIFRV